MSKTVALTHFSLLAAPEVVLSQCEVEYRRSRGLLDQDEDGVLREMERIDRWLLEYLDGHGLANERTFYSKRSYLRDTVAASGECEPINTHGHLRKHRMVARL